MPHGIKACPGQSLHGGLVQKYQRSHHSPATLGYLSTTVLLETRLTRDESAYYYYMLFLPRGKVRPADKPQVKDATMLPVVRLARSKQDPINPGYGAQYINRSPPAGASLIKSVNSVAATPEGWCS